MADLRPSAGSGHRRSLGARGEAVARRYLERQGYRLLEANYRCPQGEVDLVFQDGDCLVFVEVRTRQGSALGTPEESLTRQKQERLRNIAQTYRQEREGLPEEWRIDVVAVEVGAGARVVRVEHLRSAVEEG